MKLNKQLYDLCQLDEYDDCHFYYNVMDRNPKIYQDDGIHLSTFRGGRYLVIGYVPAPRHSGLTPKHRIILMMRCPTMPMYLPQTPQLTLSSRRNAVVSHPREVGTSVYIEVARNISHISSYGNGNNQEWKSLESAMKQFIDLLKASV